MASLKSFFPELGEILGMSPDELYNRQRALVSSGVLKAVAGRGPGSGVPLSEDSVAVLLIGLLSVDSLGETDHRIKIMCEARHNRYFTAEEDWSVKLKLPSFRSAVAAVLTGKLKYAKEIRVTPWSGAEVQRYKGQPRTLDYSTGEKSNAMVIGSIRKIDGVYLDRIRYALQDCLYN